MINLSLHLEGIFQGKQDPYAIMTVGDGSAWRHYTDVVLDGGSQATWPLNYSSPIKTSELRQGRFVLEAKDKEASVDALIGKAVLDMSTVFENKGEWVVIEGDLFGDLSDEMAEKAPNGHYRITMRLVSE